MRSGSAVAAARPSSRATTSIRSGSACEWARSTATQGSGRLSVRGWAPPRCGSRSRMTACHAMSEAATARGHPRGPDRPGMSRATAASEGHATTWRSVRVRDSHRTAAPHQLDAAQRRRPELPRHERDAMTGIAIHTGAGRARSSSGSASRAGRRRGARAVGPRPGGGARGVQRDAPEPAGGDGALRDRRCGRGGQLRP